MRYTLREIATIVHGTLGTNADPEAIIRGPVVIDSRRMVPGGLFIALAGTHSDGHDYLAQALAHEGGGALIALAHEELLGAGNVIAVDNVEQALGRLAAHHLATIRADHALTVIAITGSVGKTTTKDLLAHVLAAQAPTVAPIESFNNEIGLPLTVLRADESTRYLVLEMGASGPGHIAYLTSIARPDVSVVLCVGSAHMAGFGDIEGTAKAKSEIVRALSPAGIAVLNEDDIRVRSMADLVAGGPSHVVRFGEHATGGLIADVVGTNVRLDDRARPCFTVSVAGEDVPVALPVSGEHQVANALAVFAAATALGLAPTDIAAALASATPPSRYRMEVHERPDGITVVNDAYNANPESMRAALKSLAAMGTALDSTGHNRRTWAVLGEMLELGDTASTDHDALGRLAVRLNISHLLAIGPGARAIHVGAAHEGSWGSESAYVESIEDAKALLRERLMPEDVVLVKSSNGAQLYRLGEWLVTATLPAAEEALTGARELAAVEPLVAVEARDTQEWMAKDASAIGQDVRR